MAYYGYNPNIDSPAFTKAPAIGIGAMQTYDFLFKATSAEPASKYAPLNAMFIQNNSTSAVKITIKDVTYYCGASAALNIKPSDVGAFNQFAVTNVGGAAIAAGDLLITVQRKGISDTRDVVQGILGKIFGGGISG